MALSTQNIRAHVKHAAAFTVVACCAFFLNCAPAHAASIEELQAKVDAAIAAYDEVNAKEAELQNQISENQAKVDEINEKLPEQQAQASDSIRSLYKMQQSTPGLVSLLLSADSFSDFITTYQYINALQRANMEALEKLEAAETELREAQSQLEAAKAEVEADKDEAANVLAEADAALEELYAQLAAQAAAEAAAEAAAQAEAEAAAQAAAAENGESTTTSNSQGNNSITDAPSNPSASDGSEVADDATWMTGYASAYSLADNTGWDATASGETLTDDSMTVAVPIDQSYLLGRTVEISWNGITITARVNDTGGFAKYGRVLDLAGGCWKAFGFSTPNAWGVRKVSYRFL